MLEPRIPLVRDIQRAVAAHYGQSIGEMLSQRHTPRLARPRHIAMYLARELTPRSYPEIGRMFRRDHTTVMSGVSRISSSRAADQGLDADIRAISASLGQ